MKLNDKGFSLIELMLAVVVSTIVFGAITALIAFSSRSMRDTNARVELQNQAKDALNHMESYGMEAERAYWDDTEKLLILFGAPHVDDSVVPGTTPEPTSQKMAEDIIAGLCDGTKTLADIKDMKCDSYVYWFADGSVYFAKCSEKEPAGTPATPTPAASPFPSGTPAPAEDTVVAQIIDVSTLSAISDSDLRNFLLADDVKSFECNVTENEESQKQVVDIDLIFNDTIAPEYSCGKRVYLRNQ